jgi:hypothetical protein
MSVNDSLPDPQKVGREYRRKADTTIYAVKMPAPFKVETLHGVVEADAGDWLAKGALADFYPIADNVFRRTYELVSSPFMRKPTIEELVEAIDTLGDQGFIDVGPTERNVDFTLFYQTMVEMGLARKDELGHAWLTEADSSGLIPLRRLFASLLPDDHPEKPDPQWVKEFS